MEVAASYHFQKSRAVVILERESAWALVCVCMFVCLCMRALKYQLPSWGV